MLDTAALQRPVAVDFQLSHDLAHAKFRAHHVEPLLNQVADLAARCWATLSELESLRRVAFAFSEQIEVDQKLLQLEVARPDVPDREVRVHERTMQSFRQGGPDWDGSLGEAQKLYNYGDGEQQGKAGWTKAGQNLHEKRVDNAERNQRQDQTDMRLGWAVEDAAYQRETLRVRLESVDKRTRALEEGAYNLQPVVDSLLQFLRADFSDAAHRAYVAQDGLRRIYGAAESDVGKYSPPPDGRVGPKDIGALLEWSRDAIEWIVAYGQRDQSFTRVIPIRKGVMPTSWKELATNNGVALWIDHKLFQDYENVRLRGASVHLLGSAGKAPWAARLELPSAAIYFRGGETLPANLGGPLSCLCGRVENFRSARAPEVCGQVSLLNASPLGKDQSLPTAKWTIKLQEPGVDGERLSNVDDVLLELHCVGVPGGAR